MPTFETPVHLQALSDEYQPLRERRFFARFKGRVGSSVVKVDGHFAELPYPTADELSAAGTEGIDYFLGARTYYVPDAIATALKADGFTTVADPGYGAAGYGSSGFGC